MSYKQFHTFSCYLPKSMLAVTPVFGTKLSLADSPALRPDGPRSGQSAPEGRTVRACAEQIRVLSFVLRLLAKITGKARKLVCKGSNPPPL
jgi:hypothetical protein